MEKIIDKPAAELRRRAEQEARRRGEANLREMSTDAVEKTVHELQVHQIELELQNEELVRTRQELEESRNRYFDLYDFAPVGYCTLDGQAEIVEANLTLSRLLGVERAGLLKRKILVFMAPGDRDVFYSRMQEILERGGRQEMEVTFVGDDGDDRAMLVNCVPQNGPGHAHQCSCSLTDISERKRYEELLSRKENEYRSLVQGINSVILRMDPHGNIWFMNRFGLHFFGYGEEDVIGKPAVGTVFPERDIAGRDMRALFDRPEDFQQNESEAIKKGGGRAWVRWTHHAVRDEEGDVQEILSSGADISYRKEAEDTLRRNEYELKTLVDNSPDIVFRLNRGLQYTFVNPAYEKITGLTKEQLIGRTNSELGMARKMTEFWRSAAQEALESGKETTVEFEMPGLFGETCFSARVIPEFERTGLVESVLVMARNITNQKHAEEEIASLKKD